MFLHVATATFAGHCRVIIRASDSDVVVLGVSTFVTLVQRIDELWLTFRSWRHVKYSNFIEVFKPGVCSVLTTFRS